MSSNLLPWQLEANQQKTELRDAVITGTGKLHGRTIALGVMDFGSMVAPWGRWWEKTHSNVEKATQDGIPVIICSGGAVARGHVQPYADGQDLRSAGLSQTQKIAHQRIDRSYHGRCRGVCQCGDLFFGGRVRVALPFV